MRIHYRYEGRNQCIADEQCDGEFLSHFDLVERIRAVAFVIDYEFERVFYDERIQNNHNHGNCEIRELVVD